MSAVLEQLALTFDVGGHRPDQAAINVTGKIAGGPQLRKGDHVIVHILDADNEIIAASSGTVVGVGFTDKTDKDGNVTTTRKQTIKLD